MAEPALAAVRDGAHADHPRGVDEDVRPLPREHPGLVHLAPALVGPSDPRVARAERRRDRRARRTRPRARPAAARAGSRTPTCSTPGSRAGSGRSRRSAGPKRRRCSRSSIPPQGGCRDSNLNSLSRAERRAHDPQIAAPGRQGAVIHRRLARRKRSAPLPTRAGGRRRRCPVRTIP